MKIMRETSAIWWAVIIFFACLAVLFYVTKGGNQEQSGLTEDQSLQPSDSPSAEFFPPEFQGGSAKVIDDAGDHTRTRYDGVRFNPSEVTIQTETGCFVEVENAGSGDLSMRLGPYDARKQQGFPYLPIASGASGRIDPRYGTGKEFLFYAKENIAAVFIVHIDPTCL